MPFLVPGHVRFAATSVPSEPRLSALLKSASQRVASARNTPPGPPPVLFALRKRKAPAVEDPIPAKRTPPAATETQASPEEEATVLLVEDIPRVAAQTPVVEDEIPPTQESLRNRLSGVQISSVPGSPQDPEIPPQEEVDTNSPPAGEDTEQYDLFGEGMYTTSEW